MTSAQPQAAIQPIDKGSAEAQSANLVEANLGQLKAIFPEAFTEGRVDFDVLKQLLGAAVDEREEKYGLNWHGKRRARQLALTPSTGTLRPCPQESVDWDTTKNLFIEGDNLEVLKLLQKSYAGKVKLIYIDPPYNTGKDFVYPDNFQDSIKNYLELTGQVEGGYQTTSNSETSGRFHTTWLTMMYPRLKLARSLMRSDGVLFISIDEREVARLRLLLDEIFGEENFVSDLVWQSRTSISDDQEISLNHNHTLIYAKDRAQLEFHGEPLDESEYKSPDNDPRGPWKLVPLDANKPGGNTMYPIKNPKTGTEYWPPSGRSWAINPTEYQRLFDDKRIKFGTTDDAAPKKKLFLRERLAAGETKTPSSLLLDAGTTKDGTEECAELIGVKGVFDYPKPTALLSRILQYGSLNSGETIVLDFFAGSGTTGHAAWIQSVGDRKKRRFILVQLPEVLSPDEPAQKVAIKYCKDHKLPLKISALTRQRLRLASTAFRDNPAAKLLDLGFRVFSLDGSNIQAWNPEPGDLNGTLLRHAEHLVPGRTEQDVLYELLLKLGLDLAVPMDSRQIAGKTVHNIGAGTLFACLSDGITLETAEPLALGIAEWQKTLAPAGGSKLVFKDSAFADDVAKTNLAAILSQHGLDDVRSI